MPVIFNEPLSFLQRLTEYMEHVYLIHQANATPDSIERMKVTHWTRCTCGVAYSVVAANGFILSTCVLFAVCGCVRCVSSGLSVGAHRQTLQPSVGRNLRAGQVRGAMG